MKKQIIHNGSVVHYTVTGTGKPVILLHGFGEDSTVWRYQVPALAEKFRLILPDLPGSGSSPITDDMSIEGLAEAVHSIIHEEEIDACPVIGHSMGGYVALALAEKYYNHVSALGLFHSTSYADSEEKKAGRLKSIAFIEQHGAFEFLKTATLNLFSQQTKDEKPGLIDEQMGLLHNFSASALVKYYQAMMARPDRSAVLKNALIPVLFVIGKYDGAVSPADNLQQSHMPKKSYIHILANSGHIGMLEESVKSTRILEEFLLEI
ncbi:MAG: alpha/beta hydrolase [Bacteroidetes bacterium]|nr:alpha/beta hydrolase [Bacteroidota bacterium]